MTGPDHAPAAAAATADDGEPRRDPARLAAVRATGLLAAPARPELDRLARLAVAVLRVPAAFLTLVDAERDLYAGAAGLPEPVATTRELTGETFCELAIAGAGPLVIPDAAADPAYRDVPTVRSLGVAAYVGVPLVVDGQVVGSFCAIDSAPRAWTANDVEVLRALGESALRELALRRANAALAAQTAAAEAAEARQRVLLALSDRLRPLADAAEIQYAAARLLGERLGASRVGYAEILADDATALVTRDHAPGVRSIAGRYRVADYSPGLLPALRAGRAVWRDDVANAADLTAEERANHAALDVGAAADVPFLKGGRLTAVLFVHYREAHAFTAGELALLEAVAERTWEAVDRARAEAALRAGEERLRAVFEQAPVAVAVLRGRAAADLTFELVNPSYAAMIPAGRAPLGRRLGDALPEVAEAMGPVLQRVLDTGEPFVAAEYAVPLDRDGDGAPEAYFFNFVYHPLLGPGGAVEGIVGVGTEVTESVRARVHAEALAGRLRTLSENATLALFVMDEHQRCTYVNPAAERLTGFTLAELQGKALHYHVHHTRPDGTPYPLEECPIDRAFPQNMREQGTEVFVRRDGSFYEVAFTASPIREGERTVGTIVEVRDVTEERARERERERLLAAEREARTEAEAANRAKGEFLAVMSHELRTPLNAIDGYAELLEMGLRGPVNDAQREDLARVRRANRHLTGLVTDVLNFARLEAGQVTVQCQPLELGPVVADLEALVAPQVAAKGLAFAHDACAPDTPTEPHRVLADPEKLRQVLLNLIVNAIKFTEPGGRVALACERDPAAGVVRVRVTDTGRGIPAGQLGRIFDPFVQVDRQRTRDSQQGLGLGLAISRDLARAMRGDLAVESTLGEGSTFTLTLPAA